MSDITIERPTAVAVRQSVPWGQVLPYAAALTLASTFWILALRGAVGSLQHAQSPFVSWVRESLLSFPLFLLAVLGVVTLARSWFGAKATTLKSAGLTGLLLALAGTVVAVVLLAANSTYDYLLQINELNFMNATHPMCTTEGCLEIQAQASLEMQFRSLGYGSLLIVLTNLVVVGWIIMMRGGRIELAKTRTVEGVPGSVSRARDLQVLLAAGLAGTAVIHGALLPSVWNVRLADGLLDGTLAAAGLALAALIIWRPRRWHYVAAIIISQVPLALWVASSVIAPGPRQSATVHLSDLPAALLELATLVLAAILLIDGRRVNRPGRRSEHARWTALVAVLAITVLGLALSGLPGLDDYAAMGNLGTAIGHAHPGN